MGCGNSGLKIRASLKALSFSTTAIAIKEACSLRQPSCLSHFLTNFKIMPPPLDDAAIRAINNNSIALDIYAWLAFRLHALKAPTPVSWTALKTQFGSSFGAMNHFKAEFCKNLSLSMAVYPHAKVEVTQRGLTLMPSHPPVRPTQIAMR